MSKILLVFSSQEWEAVGSKDREKMGLVYASEGEFWMPFSEFCKFFSNVEICHFVNTSFFTLKKTWTESILRDKWTKGSRGSRHDRAGGCDKHDSYLDNPQVGSLVFHGFLNA